MTHRSNVGKPKTADISTLAVLETAWVCHCRLKGTLPGLPQGKGETVTYLALMEQFGCHWKVAWRAVERESDRGYLDWGVSMKRPWLTPTGLAKLEELRARATVN